MRVPGVGWWGRGGVWWARVGGRVRVGRRRLIAELRVSRLRRVAPLRRAGLRRVERPREVQVRGVRIPQEEGPRDRDVHRRCGNSRHGSDRVKPGRRCVCHRARRLHPPPPSHTPVLEGRQPELRHCRGQLRSRIHSPFGAPQAGKQQACGNLSRPAQHQRVQFRIYFRRRRLLVRDRSIHLAQRLAPTDGSAPRDQLACVERAVRVVIVIPGNEAACRTTSSSHHTALPTVSPRTPQRSAI